MMTMGSDFCLQVLDTIKRNNGKMLESALLETLRKRGINATQRELRNALLKLEITGYIRVTSLDEERKLIEIANKEKS
ncbi:MAG: hypothetical protein QXI52_06000 [Nitrososphaerota archaeon]